MLVPPSSSPRFLDSYSAFEFPAFEVDPYILSYTLRPPLIPLRTPSLPLIALCPSQLPFYALSSYPRFIFVEYVLTFRAISEVPNCAFLLLLQAQIVVVYIS